ncbi:MAG: UDP-N-acetylmuramate dehydrogenase [Clostridia bacterium]|nr:UDP-N-acetylmuramate dehydrogenase [Clostridia bacterium]
MNRELVLAQLNKLLGAENVLTDEPMSKHCTFRIGGNADFFVTTCSGGQVAAVVDFAKSESIPYFVTGNGSNLLVADKGYRGIVVNIGRNMSDVTVQGNRINAMAGATLARIANIAASNSLAGLEFASGIPGTLGGAVYMNAGAYGGEMKDVVVSTAYLDTDGNIKEIKGQDHCFGYRRSVFADGGIVLSSVMELKQGNKDDIEALMVDFNNRRRTKQPLEYPSAGSTFKRPEGYFAGKLIEDAGLKGAVIGGACVSEKHSGFIINTGGATCEDVLRLIEHTQNVVFDKFGVKLETEVKYLG